MKALTQQQFLRKCKQAHGNRYDYSKLRYKGCRERVEIICRIHGSFWQLPSHHINGCDCPTCAIAESKYSIQEFIERANLIHNGRYDYSQSIYLGSNKHLEIICRIHGPFWQLAFSHLEGLGCWDCGNVRKTNDQFIRECQEVHNSKYDYSKTFYIDSRDKVEIICPEHGSFWQRAGNHKDGAGCPACHIISWHSLGETQWLNSFSISAMKRNYTLVINGKRFNVDGYCPSTNTIYEFYGDYWHGNPIFFDPQAINRRSGQSFGDLYRNTFERELTLIDAGFKVVSIWENEWDTFISTTSTALKANKSKSSFPKKRPKK